MCESMKRTPCEYIVWHGLPLIRKEIAKSMINNLGLTEKEAAYKIGVTPAAVSQYLSGKRANNSEIGNADFIIEVNKSAEAIVENNDVLVSEICRLCKLFLIQKNDGEERNEL